MFPITYGNAWKDQLTSYNGQVIEYDVLGNPTTYRGNNLTWTKVSKLASFGNNTFKYNASGIRFKKNNTVYTLEGNKILKEIDGSKTLTYYYGVNGVVGFNYNKKDYFYCKNLQGDIVSIYRADGTKVAEYAYNAWGKILKVNNYTSDNIGTLNPFRYRSYYYDIETNLYYLETRYYDPETGRFISADNTKYLEPEVINGLNIYIYCNNNAVMGYDPSGKFDIRIAIIGAAIGAVVLGVAGGATAYIEATKRNEKGWDAVVPTLIGAGTGVVLGAGVGFAVGVNPTKAPMAVAFKLISDTTAYLTAGRPYDDWEDYAITAMSGAIPNPALQYAVDVLITPAASQLVKMGTRGAKWDEDKYERDRLVNFISIPISMGFGPVIGGWYEGQLWRAYK